MDVQPTVYLLDDASSLRQRLLALAESHRFRMVTFASPEALLQRHDVAPPGCAMLPLHFEGNKTLPSGAQLAARLPVVYWAAEASAADVVSAWRDGAAAFFLEPIDEAELIGQLQTVLQQQVRTYQSALEQQAIAARLDSLSDREREVLTLLVEGQTTKAIARELGRSSKTIEYHRLRILEKMEVDSLIRLVRLMLRFEGGPGTS